MNKIPTQIESPTGLHQRFYIQKIDVKYIGDDFFGNPEYETVFKPVDENAEYFVLRLDENGRDPKHISACRKAIITYAEEIKEHLPDLSKDLIERYG